MAQLAQDYVRRHRLLCRLSNVRIIFVATIVPSIKYADSFLVSMMLAPSVPQVLQTFRPDGSDKFLGSFSVTVYILGFVVGPLLFAPLTDLMGRIRILRFTVTFYLIFTIACALSTSLPMLIVFRFIAGCFGGAPMAIGGGVVSDLYPSGQRSRPMAWYSVGTMMGPALGPVLGGLITGGLEWRWVFWIASILVRVILEYIPRSSDTLFKAGICLVSLWFLLGETHHATLIRRATSDNSALTATEKPTIFNAVKANWKTQNVPHTLRRSITIPMIISRHAPALVILLLIGAFNGLVNMILSTLGSVFQFQYNFPPTTAGLSYLGLGLGGMLGLAAMPRISDYFGKLRPHPDGSKRPQYALPMMIIAGPLASAGLFWYGWSFQAKVFWLVPILGLAVFGFGYTSMRVCLRGSSKSRIDIKQLSTQMFLVEAVPNYTASALAAHTIFSSIGGAFIPIGTFPLYDKLGYGWGNSLIAFINLSLCIIPLAMYIMSISLGNEWIVHIGVE